MKSTTITSEDISAGVVTWRMIAEGDPLSVRPLHVWTVDDHDGLWPVPVASVVVAADEDAARALLDAKLSESRLKGSRDHPYTLTRLDVDRPHAVVLSNGDY